MSSTVPISQEKILFPEGCAWIDGKYVSINTAAVPITDFGFSRSDCTYDVVGVWDGKFFFESMTMLKDLRGAVNRFDFLLHLIG